VKTEYQTALSMPADCTWTSPATTPSTSPRTAKADTTNEQLLPACDLSTPPTTERRARSYALKPTIPTPTTDRHRPLARARHTTMVKVPLTVNDDKDWTFATVRDALKAAPSLPLCRYLWSDDYITWKRICDRLENLAEANNVDTGPQFEANRPTPTRKFNDARKREQWVRKVNTMTAFQNGSPEDRALFKHRYQDLPAAARPEWLTDGMCFTSGLKQDEQDYPTFQLYLLNTVLLDRRRKRERAAKIENQDEEIDSVPIPTLAAGSPQGGRSPSAFGATSAQDLSQRKIPKKRRASIGSSNGSTTAKAARFAEMTLESSAGSRADSQILLENDLPFGTVTKPDFDDTTVLFFQIRVDGDDLHLEYARTTTEFFDRAMHESRHPLSSPLCVSEAAGIVSDKPTIQPSIYQRDSDGRLAKVTNHSGMIAAMKMAYSEWQTWLPNRGLVFFALHKREHLSLVPKRYLSLCNWSEEEYAENHAVVDLMEELGFA
jgi:hypothetical protein